MRSLTWLVLLGITRSLWAVDPAGDWSEMGTIKPRSYVCGRADGPVRIDGRLDEPAWQAAPWTAEFVDIEGDKRPHPSQATRAKLLWDNDYLYVAAQLDETHVWATLTEHDSVIFHDNDFELFVDPDGDNHHYYEFEINALNTGWDLYLPKPYKDGGSADNGWEIAGLKSAIHIDGTLNNPTDTDRSWCVELAIPWAAFQAPTTRGVSVQTAASLRPRDGDHWRLGFSRVQWEHEVVDGQYRKVAGRREDNWVWSPQGIIDMHRPERWGFVQFVDALVTTPDFKAIAFQPDVSFSVREQLMNVYHHQKSFMQQHQRWAISLAELGIIDSGLTMQSTSDGFRATATIASADSPAQLWHVRQDSLLWRSDMQSQVDAALARAGKHAVVLQQALDGVTFRQRAGMEFLIAHMPQPDLESLSAEFLIENVREAYETLDAAPWRDTIPPDIFFNNVLPYASINERRDNWRREFRRRFLPLIQEAKTPGHAAALLNQRLYPLLNVKYSTQRKKADQSPFESMQSGLASCTGLSVLLIDACRAVGVPARFVGTPMWTDGSGNHSWTEVWDNGWHFTGAAEPNGDELDKAWFIQRASQALRDHPQHAIYAVSYAHTPLKFPMVWARNADYIHAVNVTDRYTQLGIQPPSGTARVYFRVLDPHGQRVATELKISGETDTQTWQGTTHDEAFDANDHFGLYLPVGASLKVTIQAEPMVVQEFQVPATGTTITLKREN